MTVCEISVSPPLWTWEGAKMLTFSGGTARVALLAQEPEEGRHGGAQGGRVRDGLRGLPGLSGGGRGAVLRGEEREADAVSWGRGPRVVGPLGTAAGSGCSGSGGSDRRGGEGGTGLRGGGGDGWWSLQLDHEPFEREGKGNGGEPGGGDLR